MKNILPVIAIFTMIMALSSCASSHINDKRINDAAFPAGFKDKNKILLVEKWTTGLTKGTVNRRLEREMTKNYTGKFEMVTREEIETNPKYANKDVYRYVLSNQIWSSRSSTLTQTVTNAGVSGNSTQYNNAYRLDFHLKDRIENKDYPEIGVTSNSFPKAIKRIAPVLNKRRD